MSLAANGKTVLVLGASGFVGTEVCSKLAMVGYKVVGLSRRGGSGEALSGRMTWLQCDATDTDALRKLMRNHGPFDAVVHCMGALFDGRTSLRKLNVVVSAAGSTCEEGVTYDQIACDSSFAVLEELQATEAGRKGCFVFVSAAEAGMAEMVGERASSFMDRRLYPNWLHRYLAAKRAVEAKCKDAEVRTVVMRPSFIWRWGKADILVPSCLFGALSMLRVPGFERPVHVDTISGAIAEAVHCDGAQGSQRYWQMDALAAAWNRRKKD